MNSFLSDTPLKRGRKREKEAFCNAYKMYRILGLNITRNDYFISILESLT